MRDGLLLTTSILIDMSNEWLVRIIKSTIIYKTTLQINIHQILCLYNLCLIKHLNINGFEHERKICYVARNKYLGSREVNKKLPWNISYTFIMYNHKIHVKSLPCRPHLIGCKIFEDNQSSLCSLHFPGLICVSYYGRISV